MTSMAQLVGTRLSDAQLAMPVQGYGLEPTSLGDVLHRRQTFLVFLRHYG